jgi:hypothetical protein
MPPAVSAWFTEQRERITRNRHFMSVTDAIELHGGRVFPGKATPAPVSTYSSRLSALLDSVKSLGSKLDSLNAKYSSYGSKLDSYIKPMTKPSNPRPAVRVDHAAEQAKLDAQIADLHRQLADVQRKLSPEAPTRPVLDYSAVNPEAGGIINQLEHRAAHYKREVERTSAAPPGGLVKFEDADPNCPSRVIRRFYGDTSATWSAFMNPRRFVKKFNFVDTP